MAINDEIAAGVKPVQFENPLNNMVKFANIQNDMSNMARHRQQTEAATADAARQAELDRYIGSGGRDESIIYGLRGTKDLAEIRQGETAKRLGEKTVAETDKIHDETAAQAYRNISQNPSPENIIAHNQDYQLNPHNSPEKKARSQRTADMLVALPLDQRVAWLASQGASAADLKPSQHTVASGDRTVVLSTPAYGGPSTEVGNVPMGATMKEKLEYTPKYLAEVAERDKTADDIKKTTALYDSSSGTPMREVYGSQLKDFYTRLDVQDKSIAGMKADEAADKKAFEFKTLVADLAKLEAAGEGNSPTAQRLKARIAKETNIPQADESVVVRTTTDNDGTVHFYNRFGAELRSQKNAGKTAPDSLAGPEKRMPAHILETVAKNNAAVANIDNALKQVSLYPSGFGAQAYLPDAVLQRTDPNGVTARATVANIGSLKIHDRSGAAVTVGETPRLRPFIPAVNDAPETVVKKLKELRREMLVMDQEYKKTLSEQGYRTGSPAEAGATRTGATVSNWN